MKNTDISGNQESDIFIYMYYLGQLTNRVFSCHIKNIRQFEPIHVRCVVKIIRIKYSNEFYMNFKLNNFLTFP